MNGRRLFRQYAQSLGKEAKEFDKIIEDRESYGSDDNILITKDNSGNIEMTRIDYKKMVHWIIKTFPNLEKKE